MKLLHRLNLRKSTHCGALPALLLLLKVFLVFKPIHLGTIYRFLALGKDQTLFGVWVVQQLFCLLGRDICALVLSFEILRYSDLRNVYLHLNKFLLIPSKGGFLPDAGHFEIAPSLWWLLAFGVLTVCRHHVLILISHTLLKGVFRHLILLADLVKEELLPHILTLVCYYHSHLFFQF